MSTLTQSVADFPAAIADVVRQAVQETLASILGVAPTCEPDSGALSGGAVIGVIGFCGEPSWSLALVLPETTAPALSEKFAGMEIPFDSPDMGDVVGELANVIAGDVRARLDRKRIKAEISLPTVARGHNLELLLPEGAPVTHLRFASPQGGFAVHLAAARAGHPIGRKPGT